MILLFKPLAKMKHKNSLWKAGFANHWYLVKGIGRFPGEIDNHYILKTGPREVDYELVYRDEGIMKKGTEPIRLIYGRKSKQREE